MATARKICAWCGISLGEADGDFNSRFPVTHGVCPDCSARVLRAVSQNALRKFLDSLGVPILLVDDDVRVLAANRAACELVGREGAEIEGLKGGDVIECVHADLPGGCGRSVHCRSCVIRRAVRATYETGVPIGPVPAYPDVHRDDARKTMSLSISTERLGGVVLLRVEDLASPATPT